MFIKEFKNNVKGLAIFDILNTSSPHQILKNSRNIFFNWGIIWDMLSPLLFVAAISLLFGLGIRDGEGRDLGYFVFVVFFFFNLRQIVEDFLQTDDDLDFFKNRRQLNYFLIFVSRQVRIIIQSLIRFVIVLIVMIGFDYKIQILSLSVGFLILHFLSVILGLFASTLIQKNLFLKTIFRFFMLALFFTSDVIVPIQIWPENIREYLLYNPIVHVNGYIKESVTGIYYDYINLSYSLKFSFFSLFASLLLLNVRILRFRIFLNAQ